MRPCSGVETVLAVVFPHQGKCVWSLKADFLCVVNRPATTGWRQPFFLRSLDPLRYFPS